MKDADRTRVARTRIPVDLTTGCYSDFDSTGVKADDCAGRVTHNRDLNKDTPPHPAARKPATTSTAPFPEPPPRPHASGTISRPNSLRTYPDHRRGEQMICALVHDDPNSSCP